MFYPIAKQAYNRLESYPNLREQVAKVYTLFASRGNTRKIHGSNNRISASGSILKNVMFDISGNDNSIVIGKESNLNGVKFHIRGSNHKVLIGERCTFYAGSTIWIEDDNCSLIIGNRNWIESFDISLTESNSKIEIGSDCLFSYDIDIRCGDSHAVIDILSGNKINHAEDIVIQDHVWIAAHTIILKGVTIGSNSIIASGAVCTKDVEKNVIVAGNPAKVVKTEVTWKSERF
jgi:acetyltransferase-like isoleucine patch superfamily enzyme